MSPKTKSSLLNVSVFLGAVVAVAGLTGSAKRLADANYVRADTFNQYRLQRQGSRSLDSARIERKIDEIQRALARVDSNTQCNRRKKPAWCE